MTLNFKGRVTQILKQFISRKGAVLVYMLLFSIDRKAYVVSPLEQLHFTLVNLIDRGQGHLDFETVYLVKEQT